MTAVRLRRLTLVLCIGLATAVCGCGARYQVESRTSTNRNDNRGNGGGTTIILISSASNSTDASNAFNSSKDGSEIARVTPEEAFGPAASRLAVTEPSLDQTPDGSGRVAFQLDNTSAAALHRVVVRLVFETQVVTYANEHVIDLEPPLAPESSLMVELTANPLPGMTMGDTQSLHVVAQPIELGSATRPLE